MRTLFLMRHSHAEAWSTDGDHGRHLTGQGRQNASEAGLVLRERDIDQVLCSSAVRATETVASLGLGDGVPVESLDELYDCGTLTLLRCIGRVPDEVGTLLVVAHAPAIPRLSAELTASQEQADDLHHFPPASYSEFRIDSTWAELLDGPDESTEFVSVTR